MISREFWEVVVVVEKKENKKKEGLVDWFMRYV